MAAPRRCRPLLGRARKRTPAARPIIIINHSHGRRATAQSTDFRLLLSLSPSDSPSVSLRLLDSLSRSLACLRGLNYQPRSPTARRSQLNFGPSTRRLSSGRNHATCLPLARRRFPLERSRRRHCHVGVVSVCACAWQFAQLARKHRRPLASWPTDRLAGCLAGWLAGFLAGKWPAGRRASKPSLDDVRNATCVDRSNAVETERRSRGSQARDWPRPRPRDTKAQTNTWPIGTNATLCLNPIATLAFSLSLSRFLALSLSRHT